MGVPNGSSAPRISRAARRYCTTSCVHCSSLTTRQRYLSSPPLRCCRPSSSCSRMHRWRARSHNRHHRGHCSRRQWLRRCTCRRYRRHCLPSRRRDGSEIRAATAPATAVRKRLEEATAVSPEGWAVSRRPTCRLHPRAKLWRRAARARRVQFLPNSPFAGRLLPRQAAAAAAAVAAAAVAAAVAAVAAAAW